MGPNDEKTGGNFTKNQIICHVNSDESRWWLRSRCVAAAAAAEAAASSSFLNLPGGPAAASLILSMNK